MPFFTPGKIAGHFNFTFKREIKVFSDMIWLTPQHNEILIRLFPSRNYAEHYTFIQHIRMGE
jgi:hypothetical protein